MRTSSVPTVGSFPADCSELARSQAPQRRWDDRGANAVGRSVASYPVEGVKVNVASQSEALREAIGRTQSGAGFALFTLNLDHLVKIRQDKAFHRAYRRANLITADGWPVVWLANRMGQSLERTCGSDLVEPLCQSAAANCIPVFFVGPGLGSQTAAIEMLESRYPGLRVAGRSCEKISTRPTWREVNDMADQINASGARICFVSLGAPKQELLADALLSRCPAVGFLCVGAALDFLSGEVRRAPEAWRHAKLEWAWRLIGDPRRLVNRYLLCAYELLLLALKPASDPLRLR